MNKGIPAARHYNIKHLIRPSQRSILRLDNVSDYRHWSVTLLNIPAYLAARSIDPIESLRLANVPAAFFSDINAFIPRELCFALEHRLQRLTVDRP